MNAPTRLSGLTIAFAHETRDFAPAARDALPGHRVLHISDPAELRARIAEIDVLIASYMWDNALIPLATRLKYVQVVSSGTDAFDLAALAARGIMVCNGRGVNAASTAEHGVALMMALARQIPLTRDNQHRHVWRDPAQAAARQVMELEGKTLLLVGHGEIGQRVGAIARALGMQLTVLSRSARPDATPPVLPYGALKERIGTADVILFCCPLSADTRHLLDAEALARARPSAYVVNIARGGVIDQDALIAALRDGRIRGAALDVTTPEPLGAISPLWDMPNVLITPHTAGDTPAYEARIAGIVHDNAALLAQGGTELINRVA